MALTISRPDISSLEITEYPVDSRFIKLPIVNYLKLLDIWNTVNGPQMALINAVNNPKYRFVCAALSRRLGKTYISNVIGQLTQLLPGTNVLIISPNFSLSSISFELQRKLIKHFDLELTRDNVKDRVLELANGSTVRLGSVGTVDSCVGRSYDLIIFDEAALSDGGEAAFNIALRPTLDKPGSKAIFISTPRGKANWFSRFFDRGFSPEFPQWVSIHADYHENARMSEQDVQEARSVMSKAEFEQEYMASFSVYEGQIYSFDLSCVQEFELGDNYEFLAGLDVGFRDPTALIILAYKDERFHVVAEYLEAEAVTSKHAEAFKGYIDRYGIETIFIDSAAAQFASDLAYTYDIATIKAKKDVLPGIAYVQTLVENNRLLVDPSCTHTLEMLSQYKWDSKDTAEKTMASKERPVHDRYSHMADALRYAIYSFTL